MTPDLWIAFGVALLGAGGLGAVLQGIFKPSSKADLIKVAQEAAQAVIGDLRGEVDRLQKRVEDLEADNETCRGENWNLHQQLSSLEDILRKAGIPIPARDMPGSFIVIEKDRTTVMRPRKASQ